MSSLYGYYKDPLVDEKDAAIEFMKRECPGILAENLMCDDGKILPAGTVFSDLFFDTDQYSLRVDGRFYYSDNKPVLR